MHTAFNPMGVGDMAKDYIIDYGNNSNGWYRKWKSGFIEQWIPKSKMIPGSGGLHINFAISFTNINSICIVTNPVTNNTLISQPATIIQITLSSFDVDFQSSSIESSISWYACGF